ncbi:MAG: AsmA family protein [Ectothiorhodospiraceae bacterium]|jgi:AsmA protein|nr:AsmA family protein [Ectothiorhodospiraceae bacterium]
MSATHATAATRPRRRIARLLLVAALLLVLLTIGLLALFVLTFDPNAYRERLVQTVHERTGRTLVVDRPIGFTLFPRLGIELDDVRLGNAPGFGDEAFAHLRRAELYVDLVALLKRQIKIDALHIEGLSIDLLRDAEGRGNWEDLLSTSPSGDTPARSTSPPDFELGQVDIVDARLRWRDQTSGAHYEIDPFALELDTLHPGRPAVLGLELTLHDHVHEWTLPLALKARLSLEPKDASIVLDELALDTPGGRIEGHIAIRDRALRFDLRAATLALDPLLPPSDDAPTALEDVTVPDLPLAMLRGLDVAGRLGIERLRFKDMEMIDVRLDVDEPAAMEDR